MTDLKNIKSITIADNVVKDVSQHHLKRMPESEKLESLATVKCAEEVFKNKIDFYSLHDSNILRDELTCDVERVERIEIGTNHYYDVSLKDKVHDLKMSTAITEANIPKFSYDSDALLNSTKEVYLASNINFGFPSEKQILDYNDEPDEGYMCTCYSSYDYDYDELIVLKLIFDFECPPDTVFGLSNYFFKGIQFDTAKNQENMNLYKNFECTEPYNGTTVEYIDDEMVYTKSVGSYCDIHFALTNENKNKLIEKFGYYATYSKDIKGNSHNVLILDDVKNSNLNIKVSDKIYNLGFLFYNSDEDRPFIDYPNCNINSIRADCKLTLKVSGSYTNQDSIIENGPETLILTSSYFDNELINSKTPAGHFSDFSDSYVSTILVEENLNSDLDSDDLLTELKRILCFNNVEFINPSH